MNYCSNSSLSPVDECADVNEGATLARNTLFRSWRFGIASVRDVPQDALSKAGHGIRMMSEVTSPLARRTPGFAGRG